MDKEKCLSGTPPERICFCCSSERLLLLFFSETWQRKRPLIFLAKQSRRAVTPSPKPRTAFTNKGHVPLHQGSGAHSRAGATGGKNSARQRSQKCQILGSGSGTTPSTRANSSTVDAPTSSRTEKIQKSSRVLLDVANFIKFMFPLFCNICHS